MRARCYAAGARTVNQCHIPWRPAETLAFSIVLLPTVVFTMFVDRMLSWPEGGIEADGVWAPHWYHNIHRSTGFLPYRPKTDPFPERLQPLLEECRPYYDRLFARALRAEV